MTLRHLQILRLGFVLMVQLSLPGQISGTVILADGQRLGTGSVVGDYVIEDISLTEVTLRNANEQLIWRP